MDNRKCYVCKNIKLASEFSRDKRRKGGFKYECKECERLYYLEHKNERKAYIKPTKQDLGMRKVGQK